MDTTSLPSLDTEVSRIGLNTEALAGPSDGAPDAPQALDTVLAALDRGINLIDTAPVHGKGEAERRVGQAIDEYGRREEVVLATRGGLDWTEDGTVVRRATPEHLREDVARSLDRLQTDYLDLYLVDWPDPLVPTDEAAGLLRELQGEGLIRAIGVSHFAPSDMDTFRRAASLDVCRSRYNLFERGIEGSVRSYCQQEGIGLMACDPLCRGLLAGSDVAAAPAQGAGGAGPDPKRQSPHLEQYRAAVEQLAGVAQDLCGGLAPLAVRWVLDQGVDVVGWRAQSPDALGLVEAVSGWSLTEEHLAEIDRILDATIEEPVSPDFLAPAVRQAE